MTTPAGSPFSFEDLRRAPDVEGPNLVAVDASDRLWELNRNAERALQAGELGESGGGALAGFRAAAALRPGQPRALKYYWVMNFAR